MNTLVNKNPYLNHTFADFFSKTGNLLLFRNTCNCSLYIYKRKLNLTSFSKMVPALNLTLPILGIPASVETPGFAGKINEIEGFLKEHIRNLPVLLILNAETPLMEDSIVWGETLPNILFENRFSSFQDYLGSMRSDYRNKWKKALKKTKDYIIKLKPKDHFDKVHYELYLMTYERSSFPLEKLSMEFFSAFPQDEQFIEISENNGKPIGFAFLSLHSTKLSFLFGGTCPNRLYPHLYARLLLEIIRYGINHSCSEISLGQTAEDIKLKLGGKVRKRYAGLWFRSPALRKLASFLADSISYQYDFPAYRVFPAS